MGQDFAQAREWNHDAGPRLAPARRAAPRRRAEARSRPEPPSTGPPRRSTSWTAKGRASNGSRPTPPRSPSVPGCAVAAATPRRWSWSATSRLWCGCRCASACRWPGAGSSASIPMRRSTAAGAAATQAASGAKPSNATTGRDSVDTPHAGALDPHLRAGAIAPWCRTSLHPAPLTDSRPRAGSRPRARGVTTHPRPSAGCSKVTGFPLIKGMTDECIRRIACHSREACPRGGGERESRGLNRTTVERTASKGEQLPRGFGSRAREMCGRTPQSRSDTRRPAFPPVTGCERGIDCVVRAVARYPGHRSVPGTGFPESGTGAGSRATRRLASRIESSPVVPLIAIAPLD